MSLTPTLDRIPRPWLIGLSLGLALAIVWGAGWFCYDLPASFLLVPTILSAAITIPLIALEQWKRRRKKKLATDAVGKCPTCTYDLRAHKPGAKCPECGTTVSGATV